MKSEIDTFDGLDNRRELMILLQRLGSDERRAAFLTRLSVKSRAGFAACRFQVVNQCDPVSAYYMLVGCCNELGVSINDAAQLLEREVRLM